jgi:DnaJ-class molecular chaperone
MVVKEESKGDRCPECNGTGTIISGMFEVECDNCSGTGFVNSPNACKGCRGSGKIILTDASGIGLEIKCDYCNGSGLEPRE